MVERDLDKASGEVAPWNDQLEFFHMDRVQMQLVRHIIPRGLVDEIFEFVTPVQGAMVRKEHMAKSSATQIEGGVENEHGARGPYKTPHGRPQWRQQEETPAQPSGSTSTYREPLSANRAGSGMISAPEIDILERHIARAGRLDLWLAHTLIYERAQGAQDDHVHVRRLCSTSNSNSL